MRRLRRVQLVYRRQRNWRRKLEEEAARNSPAETRLTFGGATWLGDGGNVGRRLLLIGARALGRIARTRLGHVARGAKQSGRPPRRRRANSRCDAPHLRAQ